MRRDRKAGGRGAGSGGQGLAVRTALTVLTALTALTAPLAAQISDATIRGLDLERQGRWTDAAAAFRSVLAHDPANVAALLGAERVYAQLGRRDSVQALVARALAVDSTSTIVWSVALRTARAAGGEEGAAAVLRRWMAAAPRSESPYHELTRALLASGRTAEAADAVAQARRILGDTVLRPDMAQVDVQAGKWAEAAQEWRAVLVSNPPMASAAIYGLQAAPAAAHAAVVRGLAEPDSNPNALRVGAELLLAWHSPAEAWALFQRTLTAPPSQAQLGALQGFADRARAQPGQASQRVAGEALEQLARRQPGALAVRTRVESARAFWAGGDEAAARRLLQSIADDRATPPDVAAASVGTLITMAARSGDAQAAADLLERRRALLPAGEAAQFGLIVAHGWLVRGELAKAEQAVAADSSLAGDEVRGWVALYRGDLSRARALLRASGGRSSTDDPAERAGVVALLQSVDVDSSPALGAALLLAARRDTAGSARALAALAASGDPAARTGQGQAALLEAAARLAIAVGDSAQADSLWSRIITRLPDTSPAAAAMLAAARLKSARGDAAGATAQLEAMILRYPESALVPEARRELDQLKGLVPHP